MISRIRLAILLGSGILLAQTVPSFAYVDWNWNSIATNTKELDKAMTSYQGGDTDGAIATLNGMKNQPSPDVRAIHILADIYREQKRYSEAKKEIQDLQNIFARYMQTHNVSPPYMNPNGLKLELGDICQAEGNLPEALNYFREVATSGGTQADKAMDMVGFQSTPTIARSKIAKVYEAQGEYENAKAEYKEIVDSVKTLSAGDKNYYLERISQIDKVLAAKAQGQTAALPSGGLPTVGGLPSGGLPTGGLPSGGTSSVSTGGYPNSVALAPRSPAGTGPLAVAAEEIASKKYESAITRLKAVIAKAPTNAQAHYLLAVAYASSHQAASAVAEYEATLKYAQDLKLQKLATVGLTKIQGK